MSYLRRLDIVEPEVQVGLEHEGACGQFDLRGGAREERVSDCNERAALPRELSSAGRLLAGRVHQLLLLLLLSGGQFALGLQVSIAVDCLVAAAHKARVPLRQDALHSHAEGAGELVLRSSAPCARLEPLPVELVQA